MKSQNVEIIKKLRKIQTSVNLLQYIT